MKNDSGKKVYIVDDDLFSLKLMASLLVRHDFPVVEIYQDAKLVLDVLAAEDGFPDLVFLDLNMPGMDGLEMIRRLGECGYSGGLILVSGQSERIINSSAELSRVHQVNIIGTLKKPVNTDALSKLLGKFKSHGEVVVKRECHYSVDDIISALEHKQFINYYQPKVSMKDGTVKGFEALVRWAHPEHGLVYPDQFIYLVERYGYIDDLTKLVVKNAIDDFKVIGGRDKLQLSINLSMLSLINPGFMDEVCRIIDAEGMSPHHFLFEITEGKVLDDKRQPLEILTRLRLRGFGLAIDDFGTAYSNLDSLNDFPFEELKLDRKFVHNVSQGGVNLEFYNATLSLARRYAMNIVAEGVEHHEDWLFLKNTGCDFAQGYLIARPMPMNDINSWLMQWKEQFSIISLKQRG
ncbi:EAL domain-containing protein [Oceanisphaera sp.]|uniref:EAL domain-containing response regulator n=1 Tax=Oceanisphaera sp. TaxID=1929979 RepID=UPI003A923443